MKKYFTIFALGMMALSTAAFAATTATGTNTGVADAADFSHYSVSSTAHLEHRHCRCNTLRCYHRYRNRLRHELWHG